MKTRKNIRDAFKYNGGNSSLVDDLKTVVITSVTNYPGKPNDMIIYYNDGSQKCSMSFADGKTLLTTTTTTLAPTTTTTTTL